VKPRKKLQNLIFLRVPHVIAEDRALPITVDLQSDSTAAIKRRDQIEDAKASLREMIDQLSRSINIT